MLDTNIGFVNVGNADAASTGELDVGSSLLGDVVTCFGISGDPETGACVSTVGYGIGKSISGGAFTSGIGVGPIDGIEGVGD